MGDWWALMWDVKPGSEEEVQELFKNYKSPDPIVKDEEGNEKGKLLRTVVFMKGQTIVRAVEIEVGCPTRRRIWGGSPRSRSSRRSSTRTWRSRVTCRIPTAPATSSSSRSCRRLS